MPHLRKCSASVLLFVVSFCLSLNSYGAIYYVTANGKGDGMSPSTPMSGLDLRYQSFLPGDQILLSSSEGSYNYPIILDNLHGSSTEHIIIIGDNNTLVNVESSRRTPAILVKDSDYLTLDTISVKGNGGSAAIEVTNSGTSGEGFTIVGRNLNVLSNSARNDGNNDGFAANNGSMVVLYDPQSSGTHPPASYEGSHQSITAHGNSHFVVYDAIFTDTNYWAVPVDDSSIKFFGGMFSGTSLGSFEIGANGTENSFIHLLETQDNPLFVEIDNAIGPKSVSNLGTILIQGGVISIKGGSSLVQTANKGHVSFKDITQLTIDSPAWRYLGYGTSTLEISDSNVYLDEADTYFFRLEQQASLLLLRNQILSTTSDVPVYFNNYTGNSEIISNNVCANSTSPFIRNGTSASGNISIYQNSFFGANTAIELSTSLANSSIAIQNNIFGYFDSPITGLTGPTTSNNAFFRSLEQGANSIITNFEDSALRSTGNIVNKTNYYGLNDLQFEVPPNIGPYAGDIPPQLPSLSLIGDEIIESKLNSPFTDPGYQIHPGNRCIEGARLSIESDLDTNTEGTYHVTYYLLTGDEIVHTETRTVQVTSTPTEEQAQGGAPNILYPLCLILALTRLKYNRAFQTRR